jgi:hypothetical protein
MTREPLHADRPVIVDTRSSRPRATCTSTSTLGAALQEPFINLSR